MPKQEYFKITSLHREDINRTGYKGTDLSDVAMRNIARLLGRHYVEGGQFWQDLDTICEDFKIPKLEEGEE